MGYNFIEGWLFGLSKYPSYFIRGILYLKGGGWKLTHSYHGILHSFILDEADFE